MTDMKLLKPKMVKTGPIFENVLEGDNVDVLKLPVPIHHQRDTHRYIGTADMCMTKDPGCRLVQLRRLSLRGL